MVKTEKIKEIMDVVEGVSIIDKFKQQGLLFYFGAIFLIIVLYSGIYPFSPLNDLELICFTIIGLVLMILGVQFRIVRYKTRYATIEKIEEKERELG